MTPQAKKATGAKKATRPKKATTAVVPEVADDEVADVADGQVESDQTSQGGMVTADGKPLATAEVTFRGKTMTVHVPDAGQLAVIQRFTTEYSTMEDQKEVPASVAIKMERRAILVARSVLADENDRDFVEEGVLAGDFKIWDVMPVMKRALDLLQEVNAPNREQRRATEKKSRLVTE